MLRGRIPLDVAFAAWLLDRHPSKTEKVGPGIARFYIAPDGYGFRNNCFWIERTDGTCVRFSYPCCLAGKSSSHKSRVLLALRAEIQEQIVSFRKENAAIKTCAISGKPLGLEPTHVDHAPPRTFKQISEEFLLEYGSPVETIAVADSVPMRLADRELAAAWHWWHNERATLRLVLASKNLRARD